MFENIIGNKKVKQTLNNIKEPSHAYMFIGRDGIGKFLFAKEFANKWLCGTEDNDKKPCRSCKSCVQLKNDNNINFQIINSIDEVIKVEQIRELIKKIYEKPIDALKKVYIINDADKMTLSAQNALLKVLEEPPTYIIIILIGSNEHLFLNTIKSRCIKIVFEDLEKEELKSYLKNNGKIINDKYLDMYQGSIGNAEKLIGLENKYLDLETLIFNMSNLNEIQVIQKFSKIITKDNFKDILEYMNILFFKLSKDNSKYVYAIEKVNDAMMKLKHNCNFEMVVDNMLLDIYKISN